MSTMLVAKLMTMGVHPALAILVALACGLLIGVINGFLVGKSSFRLSSQRLERCLLQEVSAIS